MADAMELLEADDLAYFDNLMREHLHGTLKGLCRQRKYFFCYTTDVDQLDRWTEWEKFFAAIIIEKPMMNKSVMWQCLRKFYQE